MGEREGEREGEIKEYIVALLASKAKHGRRSLGALFSKRDLSVHPLLFFNVIILHI